MSGLCLVEFDIVLPAPFDGEFFYGVVAVSVPFVFDAVFIYRIFESPKGAAAAYQVVKNITDLLFFQRHTEIFHDAVFIEVILCG